MNTGNNIFSKNRVGMAIVKEIVINNKHGLHARPAMMFVKIAKDFCSRVTVSKGEAVADGKSILEIMTLAAEKGARITLKVEGEDEASAFAALEKLVSGEIDGA